MSDFIATPFVALMFACAFIASFLTGKVYIIAEVEEDDVER